MFLKLPIWIKSRMLLTFPGSIWFICRDWVTKVAENRPVVPPVSPKARTFQAASVETFFFFLHRFQGSK